MDRPRPILTLLGGGLTFLAACLAPRPGAGGGEEISAEEAGRRLAAGGTPVTGEVVDGRELPPSDAGLALPDPAALEQVPTLDVPDEPRENPYLRFGERILVHTLLSGEAVITKPYPLPPGRGEDMLHLIQALQPFPYKSTSLEQSPVAGEPDPAVVELLLLPGWDKENVTDPKPGPTSKPPDKGTVLSDLLVVTAGYERLEEVEDFINLFAAGVRQIEIEAKIVEVVESDLTDIGIKPIPGTPIFDFPEGTFVDSLDYNLPNSVDPTEALLTLGAVQDGLAFNAILEALESFSNVSIDQRPKVAVREGVSASIASTEEIPFYEIGSINPSGNFSSALKFKSVGIELYVTPRVVGTETLALDVHVIASQRVGSVPTFTLTGEALDTPLIATRTAKTVVYLKPGQALIIGGLTAERATQVINQVPILGEIPILGLLFRSKRDTTEKAYSMFVISPRIIQGNEFNASL
jgi:type II secretory pathway component GspD/PulD (secretin)